MKLLVSCPQLKSGGQRDVCICLYKCKKKVVAKCAEYLKVYPDLLTFEVDAKLQEKYGPPEIPVPLKLQKRRKRRTKAEMEFEKTRKEWGLVEEKPKRKRRTKAEMAAARGEV